MGHSARLSSSIACLCRLSRTVFSFRCPFVFTFLHLPPLRFWLVFMFVRSCPYQMLHSRTYLLVVGSSLPTLFCQSDSPFLLFHLSNCYHPWVSQAPFRL